MCLCVCILGGTLTFLDNGLFIVQTNSSNVREREEKTKVQRLWPVVVSIKECSSGRCDKDGRWVTDTVC